MNNKNNKFSQIVIYGGGLNGLTLASSINNLFEEVIILEPLPKEKYIEISKLDTRTTALSYQTVKFMEECNLWNDIEPKSGAIKDIRITDSAGTNKDSKLKLDFAANDVSMPAMGYIVKNNDLKKSLLKNLKGSNVSIEFGTQIKSVKKDDILEISLSNGKTLKTELLIASDGKNSKIRQMLDIETYRKNYNQSAITFNIKHDKPHHCLALERFSKNGPFAVLPMQNQNESSIVWTVKSEQADFYRNLSKTDLKEHLKPRVGDFLGGCELTSEVLVYPLSLVYIKEYFKNRVAFIGDSAHGIHPIAGQGYNQGVKDCITLCEVLKESLANGLDIGADDALQKYQDERLGDNLQMITATDSINEIFAITNPLMKVSRRVGISAVDKIKPLKEFFIKKAMGEF